MIGSTINDPATPEHLGRRRSDRRCARPRAEAYWFLRTPRDPQIDVGFDGPDA